jgi:DNA-binding response OmpR family regulator
MGNSFEWSARTRRQEDRFPVRGAACVVEPDDVARAQLADGLRGMGYTTHETGSGAVGAFIADQIHLQVALVNVALTDANGLKLIRRFRSKHPDAAIVALTPDAPIPVGMVLAHFAGADATLGAHPTSEALSAAVIEAVGHPHEQAPLVAT